MRTKTHNLEVREVNLKRYDLVDVDRGYLTWKEMHEDETGEYVRYSDIAPLLEEARNNALQSAIEACRVDVVESPRDDWIDGYKSAIEDCTTAIHKLKSKPIPEEVKG